MTWLWLLGIAIGAVLGSFFGVVIERGRRKESIVWPASHCVSCDRALRPYENVPILAYLVLRGRCRTCHTAIPALTLYCELAGAGVGLGLALTAIAWWPRA